MSKLFSLSDLNKKQEEDEKKRNEYYAGGNDSKTGGGSGLSVLDPHSGDTLSRIVNNASNPGDTSNLPATNGRRVTLYRNGFTVDDGPLRDLTSAESRLFLAALADGYVPQELMQSNKSADVAIELSDKRSEDYAAPPAPSYIAFGGEAMSLRSSVSADIGTAVITPDIISVIDLPTIDAASPVTTLQVRLMSGKKVRIRVNHLHTVLQLAALLNREEPISRPFSLSAGFPPQDITDFSATIADAGLIGASVTQKPV